MGPLVLMPILSHSRPSTGGLKLPLSQRGERRGTGDNQSLG